MEEKIKELSKTIITYSLRLKENETVLIKSDSIEAKPLVTELVKEAYEVGAVPMVRYTDQETNHLLM